MRTGRSFAGKHKESCLIDGLQHEESCLELLAMETPEHLVFSDGEKQICSLIYDKMMAHT